jgi:O-antigen/teichoic acid export membrane protein
MVEGAEAQKYVVLYGTRISRDTAIYAVGSAIVFPFSLINVVVLTRFLEPAEYGQLAVLYVFAGLLTTVYNAGSLQGVLMSVFRGSADDVEVDDETLPTTKGSKSGTLGTGLILTLLIAGAATIVLCGVARPLGQLLLGGQGHSAAIRWAAASAGLGAVWRLAVNVFRYERRPGTFAVLNSMRPAFALAGAAPLVATGHGVSGALAGTALGTAVGLTICILVARRSYALAFHLRDAVRIMLLGARFLPVIAGGWALHNVDVLMLSRFAPEADVGLYRLAGRVAVFLSYFVSAFLMAWSPLEATSLFRATYARLGRPAVRATLVSTYLVVALVILLAMAVSADVLVQIAAPSYAKAAPLIAPIGFGFVGYGGFVVLARASRIPHRMRTYGWVAVGSALLLVGLGLFLMPWLGGYGAALSMIGATTAGITVFMVLISRSDESLPFEYRRMATALALSGACYAAITWANRSALHWRGAAEVGAFCAYLGLLVLTNVVPRSRLAILLLMARGLLPNRRARRELLARLTALPPTERGLVTAAARGTFPPGRVSKTGSELVRALRMLGGIGGSSERDDAIAAYLLSTAPSADRDAMMQRLWERGVEPADLHAIESTLDDLRRVPRRAWRGRLNATELATSR